MFDVVVVHPPALPSSSDFDTTTQRDGPHPPDAKRTVYPIQPAIDRVKREPELIRKALHGNWYFEAKFNARASTY